MTFTELHAIVNPDEAPDSWDRNERRRIMRRVKNGESMDVILAAMDLFPTDWTVDQKREMIIEVDSYLLFDQLS